jgi:hypothetical protein
VVLLAGGQIWDLDTLLPFPCDADEYLDMTFAHVGRVEPDWDPMFRIVDREEFVSQFSSDRSHMRDAAGAWMQPPPDWPAIGEARPNNLQSFIDMDDTTFGIVCNLTAFREICRL